MLYQGFTQSEINKITAILDKHEAHYELSAGLGEDGKKVPRDSAVLQIEISEEELGKVSEQDRLKLNDLRIHGEMPNPFEDEEIMNAAPIQRPAAPGPSKANQAIVIVGVILMISVFLLKKLGAL